MLEEMDSEMQTDDMMEVTGKILMFLLNWNFDVWECTFYTKAASINFTTI